MELVKVYEEMRVNEDHVILDGEKLACEAGKHCIWIPGLEAKVIWSHCGMIEALKDWDKGLHREIMEREQFVFGSEGPFDHGAQQSILSEFQIFRDLSERKWSPKVKGFLFVKKK